jgi:putative Mn2+ efflux pump MntP
MKTSKTSQKTISSWRQIVSFFLLPAIGLYIIAYQFIGKRCSYRWGNFDVTPLEPISKNEYLFTRLFPSGMIILGIMLIMLVSYILGIPVN